MPEGWQGKNHACHQLSQAAAGEWLLFADADTHHEPSMLKSALKTAVGQKAQMVSTFPKQIFSKGDEFVVPLMFFILLSFLPMFFVAKRTWKWAGTFATACGQFLLIRRDAYDKVGGHLAIKARISEGPLLAARIKDAGFKILLRDGSRHVSCRMYENFDQAFTSFSRSVFASMGGSTIALAIFLFLQVTLYVVPYFILAASPWLGFEASDWLAVAVMILIPIGVRYRIHFRTGMSRKFIPMHFISMNLYHWIMLNSFMHYRVKKKTVWKNRSYASPQA
jgi:chlorobactene glucosyltransferase